VRAVSARTIPVARHRVPLSVAKGRGSLEKIALLAQPRVLPAQPHELGALIGRDAVVALTAIDLVLAMPVAQCLLGDAKALRQLARRAAGAKQLDRLGTELRRIGRAGSRHDRDTALLSDGSGHPDELARLSLGTTSGRPSERDRRRHRICRCLPGCLGPNTKDHVRNCRCPRVSIASRVHRRSGPSVPVRSGRWSSARSANRRSLLPP
jgi:hypothetical protein